jgi:hypothetical protein
MRSTSKLVGGILLAAPVALVEWGGFDAWHRVRGVGKEMEEVSKVQLPTYGMFLKAGMTRAEVEEALRGRRIDFESAWDGSHGVNDFVRLKRLPSPHWYCSFEDVGIVLDFRAGDGAGPSAMTSNDDVLERLESGGQLMDCL